MTFLDRIAEPEIHSVFEYWVRKQRKTDIPLKRDIDPVEISPHALPWLFMFQRESSGRLRCILSGTGIVKIDDTDATGRYLDEIAPPHARESRNRLFSSTLELALPTYYQARSVTPGRASRGFSRLLLPVSATGERADGIFGIIRYREPGPMSPQEERARPGEPSLVIQATPGDLRPPAQDLLNA